MLPRSAFAAFRFPPEVIVPAMRWYLRFGLSYRDVEELLPERGIEVDHVTIYRWFCSSRCWPAPLGPAGTRWEIAGRSPRFRLGRVASGTPLLPERYATSAR